MQLAAAITAPPDGRRLAWCASARSGSAFFLEGILACLVVRVTDYVPRDEVGIALGAQAAVFGAVGLGAPLERNWSIAAVHQITPVCSHRGRIASAVVSNLPAASRITCRVFIVTPRHQYFQR